MRCQTTCRSPYACKDWGYCRQRNIDAGGMKYVTTEMQARWRLEYHLLATGEQAEKGEGA